MLTTKQEVDRHVRTAFAKLRTENERNLRGYLIAKLYFKIGEFPSALHYVSTYISVKRDNASAYKLLGKCCIALKRVESALEAYQKSLLLDRNQPDLVVEVSKLLLSDESNLTSSKVKFWKDLVMRDDSVQDESVLNLRLKLMSASNAGDGVESVIIQEIRKKPQDVNLRIRLLKQLLERKKISEAFKYVSEIETKHHEQFTRSLEWYNAVNLVLSTFKISGDSVITNKDFCCLYLNALERQIHLNLEADSALSSVRSGNLSECARILFELDQFLYQFQFSQSSIDLRAEVGIQLVNYFRGQFCLHAATLLFKRDFTGSVEWQEATKNSFVLLLHAYQCGSLEIPDNLVRQVPEVMKHLLLEWQNQSAFRCLQAGRTLLAASKQHQDLLMQIRGKCSNSAWKQALFKLLFKSSDQLSAISTSYLTTCAALTEPLYEMPTVNHVEAFAKSSSLLNPASLAHQVYVRLKTSTLSECDFTGFDCLSFSMSNLINCAPTTLNQLDIETFLYATVFQTRRELELVARRGQSGLPDVLPFANIMLKMCTEEQSNWWTNAYKMTTNGTIEDVVKVRTAVQDGLEVIRCVGNARMDAMIALKVGHTLQDRMEGFKKSAERNYLENRVELLNRYAVRQLKRYPSGSVVSTRKLFKYSPSQEACANDELDMEVLATNAVNFLGKLYTDRERYDECVEELSESSIEGAAFFVAEANKKLAAAKTPQRDSTPVASHDSSGIDSAYIKRLVQAEVRKLQMYSSRAHEESEYDFLSDEDALHGSESGFHRQRRSVLTDNTQQLQLIQQMTTLLSNLQLDFSEVKKELSDVKGQLSSLQETVETKVAQKDTAASVLEDIYRLDDEETRRQQEIPSTDYFGNLYSMYGYYPTVSGTAAQLLQQQLQRSAAMSLHQIPTTVPTAVPLYPDTASLSAAAGLSLNPQSPQMLQRQAQLYDTTLRLQQSVSDQTPQLMYPTASLATAAAKMQNTATTADQYQYSMNNSVVKTWNSTYNNAPVEKLPPVNVVITSSDPLPTHTTISTAPPLLSVTIPPQHIKQSSVVPELSAVTPPNADVAQQKLQEDSQVDAALLEAEQRALKASDEDGEIVRFSGAAKLFHVIEKELLECGLGDLKILQNKMDLKRYRFFMRRDQGNKVCANHIIAPETEVTIVKGKDKTYSWTATDLVQGNLRSVKFYVKFKTSESSEEFKTAVEKIKMEQGVNKQEKTPPLSDANKVNPLSKTVSFNFGEKKPDPDKKIFPNPFSGFTFGKPKEGETEKTFSNLFTGFNTSGSEKVASVLNDSRGDTSLNRSGDGEEDEYVSTAQFQPVIPLPKLVEVKTGEEDETVLFEHRAKLLRFDKELKEWKERGIGNIKILVQKSDASKVRLLMRREQVLKLCCNQLITEDTKFTPMPNTETALTWYAQDYADNEMKTDLFAIRFKTSDICKDFHSAVLKAQANLKAPAEKKTEEAAPVKAPIGFGDVFKPKAGQWECKGCFVMNAANVTECVACKGPKEAPKKDNFSAKELTCTMITGQVEAPKVGFGDQFKPKAGSWECKGCFIRNQSDTNYCVACDSPKDDTVPKKNQSLNLSTQTKFTFGMPPITQAAPAATVPATTFSFGSAPAANAPIFSFLTATNTEQNAQDDKKPDKAFNFVFTAKSPGKVKTPESTPGKDGKCADDEVVPEEENNTYFTPVIPLPDKIDVKTGEENEEVVYCHRAKLYRFADKEWKERGTGDVKILRDKTSNVLRVLMRREPILKICLNHRLTDDIKYEKKDEKSWHFAVDDFSEGELEPMNFCLRFKTADIAQGFLDAVQKALGEKTSGSLPNGGDAKPAEVKVNGRLSGEAEEEEKLRVKLRLPERFFEYKTKPDCSGCRGCNDEEFVFVEVENINGDLVDENPIPLKLPDIPASSLIKQEKTKDSVAKNLFGTPTTQSSSFIFGGGAKSFSFGTGTSIFAPTFADTKTTTTAASAGFTTTTTPASPFSTPSLDTQKNIFGSGGKSGESLFNSSSFSFGNSGGASIFGGNSTATKTETVSTTPFSFATPATTTSGSIFGGSGGAASTFSFAAAAKSLETKPGVSIFGGAPAFGQKLEEKSESVVSSGFTFGSAEKKEPEVGKDILKMDENLSFANLAKSSNTDVFKTAESTGQKGFFGLSHNDDFSHFGASKKSEENGTGNEDSNYDPHYEPVIALPEEIKVSTGEEEETVVFSDRAHLYRFDATNKEWKERGVGDFKLLHHPEKGSYRFLLRREQIHKLVLNHAISADFKIAPMNKTGRSFCWAAMNYAEEPAQTENLAVRFKNVDIASKFERTVNECIMKVQEKGELEPEDD
ncbi:E3 SUMO-protein ligase RanBP2 [Phlebotomus argentipes]|uniref:E3 SUMO-protein ligase RanBP2 n=1 Tax=Phlebotomus argentipes TaxID=94469 RepID=UPI00289307EC|nr:E3 SUMO-protein ligase RanBP2 [Phlebotomus argentipes]